MRRRQVYVIATLLAAIGASLFLYKVVGLGFPLTPVSTVSIWDLEFRLRFVGDAGPATLTLAIPQSGGAFAVVGENFVSGEYGLTTRIGDRGRRTLCVRFQWRKAVLLPIVFHEDFIEVGLVNIAAKYEINRRQGTEEETEVECHRDGANEPIEQPD